MSGIDKEPGVTVYPISEREVTVRKAIANLARVGLRITGFKCHPMTIAELACDGLSLELQIIRDEKNPLAAFPPRRTTYCNIPIEQDANEPPPIS